MESYLEEMIPVTHLEEMITATHLEERNGPQFEKHNNKKDPQRIM